MPETNRGHWTLLQISSLEKGRVCTGRAPGCATWQFFRGAIGAGAALPVVLALADSAGAALADLVSAPVRRLSRVAGSHGSCVGQGAARSQRATLKLNWASSHEVPAQNGLSELTWGGYALLDVRKSHGGRMGLLQIYPAMSVC